MQIHNCYLNDVYLNLNLKDTDKIPYTEMYISYVNKNFGTKFNVHDYVSFILFGIMKSFGEKYVQ